MDFCKSFNPFDGVRAVLVWEASEDIYAGVIGSYGKVSGARHLIAFIGDGKNYNIQEKIGFMGEGVILEATSLGSNTCWVGALFNPEKAEKIKALRDDEHIVAITPIGYATENKVISERLMSGIIKSPKRKSLEEIVIGNHDNFTDWQKQAAEAARLAPSTVNRQPWRFEISDNKFIIHDSMNAKKFGVYSRLDCGIAMLHLDVVARMNNITGTWEFLDGPLVAAFEYE